MRSSTPSPEPETPPPPTPPPSEQEDPLEPKNTIAEGFELAACDIETLKKLCEKFDDPPPPLTKRGRKPKPPPPRKRCEVDLHQTLIALLEELEKYEMSFGKMMSKAKIKIMKESLEPEPEDEPGIVVQIHHFFLYNFLILKPASRNASLVSWMFRGFYWRPTSLRLG